MAEGIRVRHSRACASRNGRDCNCDPSYEASVWLKREHVKIRKTFGRLSEARSWRTDALKAAKDGKLAKPTNQTVQQAAEEWLAKVKAGEALTRSGVPYKPAVIREAERALRKHVLDDLGNVKLAAVRRRDLQALVDTLVGKGLSGSTIRNVLMPLRVIYRRAIEDDEIALNPTSNLRLPAGSGTRDRVATAEEAAMLLGALPKAHRALWATAFYAGLRRGELRALRHEDIDTTAGVIHVRRGWDDREGEIDPKSVKGTRDVPLAGALKLILLEHQAATGRRNSELVFGRTAFEPFTPTNIRKRALTAWSKRFQCGCDLDPDAEVVKNKDGAVVCPTHHAGALQPIGLHECRHTYVSMLHDAGFSLERIGDYVGHSSTYMTDRYRHLLDGHQKEAADVLDAYLNDRAGAHRGAQILVVAPGALR